jgi:hypothetical protein
LQKIVRDDATKVSKEIVPFVNDFFAAQRKVWTDKGGELISLPGRRTGRVDRQDFQHRRRSVERQARSEQGGQIGLRIGRAQQIDALLNKSPDRVDEESRNVIIDESGAIDVPAAIPAYFRRGYVGPYGGFRRGYVGPYGGFRRAFGRAY